MNSHFYLAVCSARGRKRTDPGSSGVSAFQIASSAKERRTARRRSGPACPAASRIAGNLPILETIVVKF